MRDFCIFDEHGEYYDEKEKSVDISQWEKDIKEYLNELIEVTFINQSVFWHPEDKQYFTVLTIFGEK